MVLQEAEFKLGSGLAAPLFGLRSLVKTDLGYSANILVWRDSAPFRIANLRKSYAAKTLRGLGQSAKDLNSKRTRDKNRTIALGRRDKNEE